MGLLFADTSSGGEFQAKSETALLQQLGCKACPLNDTPGKIDATGAARPLVYILGEAAGVEEEKHREQFVGTAGQLLRQYIPKKFLPQIRWNNILNCHPPKNRDPDRTEVECCRPRIVTDIERSKPKAIFGFGNVPLQWVLDGNFPGISFWCGRRMPVKIGSHVCWYYPFLHPSFLHRIHRVDKYTHEIIPSEDERMTELDLIHAFDDLDHLPVPVVHNADIAKANVECVTKIRDIEKALQWAARQPTCGVDYETNGLRPYEEDAKILSVAVGTLERAFAFPMMHPGANYSRTQVEDILNLWKRFLMSAPCRKIVHNLAFEMEWSAEFFGSEVLRVRPWEDTANAAAIVDERKGKRKPGCFSLEFLIQQYFGFNLKKVSNLDRSKLEYASLETVLLYNGMDSKYHDGLWHKLIEEIRREELEEAYQLAVRRVPTVVLSQLAGVPVDQNRVKVLHKKYDKLRTKYEEEISSLDIVKQFQRERGQEFNPGSNPDVLYVFDDMLGRKEVHVVDKYSKEKKRSCDEKVLSQIKHPLAKLILDFRGATHQLSTYIDPLKVGSESCVLFSDGLIHAQFNTFFTSTGRISCVRKGTQVQVPSGTKNIEDIKVGQLVYSFDENKKLVLRRIRKRWYRGKKKLVRLYWIGQGGRHRGYLDVTPDHRIRLSNGSYQAAELFKGGKVIFNRTRPGKNPGESVLAVHRVVRGGYNTIFATGRKEQKEARFVFEEVNDYLPEHVHHDNENKLDDLPANLIGMTQKEHSCLHLKKAMNKPGEASRRAFKRSAETVARVQAAVVKAIKEKAARRFTKQVLEDALRRGKGIRGATKILDCDYSTVRSRIELWGVSAELWDGRKFRPERPERRRKLHPYKGHTEYVAPSKYNHVIVQVESLTGLFPVYDLEVEDVNNFIANEICVHNCESPNLQNFPKRDSEAKEVRRPIRAPKGCVVLSFDYGQIEARVIAMFTKDKRFCKALWERYDVHQDWAERIAYDYPARVGGKKNLKEKKPMKDFRTDIKNQWTFPLFFGAKLESVAGYLNIPTNVLRPHFNKFWKEFEGVKTWQEDLIVFYNEYGYVETLTGRRRHGPMSVNELLNAPVQGTACEIVMDAMSRLSESGDPTLQPELQIHDDLTWLRTPEKDVDVVAEKIIDAMLAVPFKFVNVPITAEMSVGSDWMNLEEVGTYSSDEWKK